MLARSCSRDFLMLLRDDDARGLEWSQCERSCASRSSSLNCKMKNLSCELRIKCRMRMRAKLMIWVEKKKRNLQVTPSDKYSTRKFHEGKLTLKIAFCAYYLRGFVRAWRDLIIHCCRTLATSMHIDQETVRDEERQHDNSDFVVCTTTTI